MEFNLINYTKSDGIRKLTAPLYVKTSRFSGVYFDSEFLNIADNVITGKVDWEWNGCTCVKDSSKSDVGCCIHDLLNKYKHLIDFKVKNKDKLIDKVFFDVLEQDGFKFSKIFYYAVRFFGKFFTK